mmetsp:Transcript_121121/g.339166  ORF Transcript_121121/g.339166 Transcript_121121/m.339166 type:complete len:368 (-) Transcript_121121:243-1346(-)
MWRDDSVPRRPARPQMWLGPHGRHARCGVLYRSRKIGVPGSVARRRQLQKARRRAELRLAEHARLFEQPHHRPQHREPHCRPLLDVQVGEAAATVCRPAVDEAQGPRLALRPDRGGDGVDRLVVQAREALRVQKLNLQALPRRLGECVQEEGPLPRAAGRAATRPAGAHRGGELDPCGYHVVPELVHASRGRLPSRPHLPELLLPEALPPPQRRQKQRQSLGQGRRGGQLLRLARDLGEDAGNETGQALAGALPLAVFGREPLDEPARCQHACAVHLGALPQRLRYSVLLRADLQQAPPNRVPPPLLLEEMRVLGARLGLAAAGRTPPVLAEEWRLAQCGGHRCHHALQGLQAPLALQGVQVEALDR